MKNIITTSNKLLLGLLITILIFVTVVLTLVRMNRVESRYYQEHKNMQQQGVQPAPPAPPTPPVPGE